MTTRLTFPSGGERCAAWLTLPQAATPHPVVLLIHGGGATHAMMLDQYERWFSQAGFAVLAFDFRHLGESDGEPRQLMSPRPLFPGHRRGAGLHPHQARARCGARGAVGHVVRCQPRRGDGGAPQRYRCRRHPMPDPAGPRAGAERRPRPSAALHRPDRLRPFTRDVGTGAALRADRRPAGRTRLRQRRRAPTTAGCRSCPRA